MVLLNSCFLRLVYREDFTSLYGGLLHMMVYNCFHNLLFTSSPIFPAFCFVVSQPYNLLRSIHTSNHFQPLVLKEEDHFLTCWKAEINNK